MITNNIFYRDTENEREWNTKYLIANTLKELYKCAKEKDKYWITRKRSEAIGIIRYAYFVNDINEEIHLKLLKLILLITR